MNGETEEGQYKEPVIGMDITITVGDVAVWTVPAVFRALEKEQGKVRMKMEKLLKRIYEEIIYYEKDTVRMDRRVNQEIDQLAEAYGDKSDSMGAEELKTLLRQTALTAEREGFVLGMRYLLKLQLLLLSEEEVDEL